MLAASRQAEVELKRKIEEAEVELKRKIEDIQQKWKCSVCFFNEVELTLGCGHILCQSCMERIKNEAAPHPARCPFCVGIVKVVTRLYVV
jgi:hypothetical protein